jgi:uncharacterized protein (TIGR00290 family)
MHPMKKAAVLWSGGKDSALALYHVRQNHPDLHVIKLITCLSEAYDRVSMHGVRRELITEQAAAIGLPVEFVVIPHVDSPSCPMAQSGPGTTFPSNDTYTGAMLQAFERLKNEGVAVIVFGDIYLEDLRAFRDRLLGHAGLQGCYPLWGRDPEGLYHEFVELGLAAVTICTDTTRLSAKHCGQILNASFRKTLPQGVDPCGERGEYHSFTFNGPLFRRPVSFRLGEVHLHEPFAFQELYPDDLHVRARFG